MSVYQLIYTSQSTPDITEKALAEILAKAQINNFQHKVSGLLILYHSNFIQLLEGNKKDLTDLFAKIRNDNRHKNVQIIMEAESSNRLMPTWAMGISVIGNDNKELINKSYYISMQDVREICEAMTGNAKTSFLNFLNT
jgi:hypothetical protein